MVQLSSSVGSDGHSLAVYRLPSIVFINSQVLWWSSCRRRWALTATAWQCIDYQALFLLIPRFCDGPAVVVGGLWRPQPGSV